MGTCANRLATVIFWCFAIVFLVFLNSLNINHIKLSGPNAAFSIKTAA